MGLLRELRKLVFGRTDGVLFEGSGNYWEERYRAGGSSGGGSYDRLAEFKADILNDFVAKHEIKSVIEFGSGDGNQLSLADYPAYLGVDVSPTAVELCRSIFAEDDTKRFVTLEEYDDEGAELALSLDVVYHLVEDQVFHAYMSRLFDVARRYVIVYSSNYDSVGAAHVRHRTFTDWIEKNRSQWHLVEKIPNRYPRQKKKKPQTSFAEFYIFAPSQ